MARHLAGAAVVTLRAPPPLERPLGVRKADDGRVELHEDDTLLAEARAVALEIDDVPLADFAEAEAAQARTPYDECNHNLPNCFVCGPKRAAAMACASSQARWRRATAAGRGRSPRLGSRWQSGRRGRSHRLRVRLGGARLPTAYAGLGARHLGMNGDEMILLGRISGRVDGRPRPGDRCVIVAWPTGRDGRKLFADSALLDAGAQCWR